MPRRRILHEMWGKLESWRKEKKGNLIKVSKWGTPKNILIFFKANTFSTTSWVATASWRTRPESWWPTLSPSSPSSTTSTSSRMGPFPSPEIIKNFCQTEESLLNSWWNICNNNRYQMLGTRKKCSETICSKICPICSNLTPQSAFIESAFPLETF